MFVHCFKYYDEENKISLKGKSNIITIELSKLEQIAKKPVTEMTALERWAVFFRYTPDKDKRELVNEIIKIEEGIAMAGQVLLHISKDERERARLTSEYKFSVDLQSKMVDTERRVRSEERTEFARILLRRNRPLEEIMEDTGFSEEYIESLRTNG